MDNAKGAQAAIENLNGFLIKDKKLTVQVKLSKEELARRKEQRVVSACVTLWLIFCSGANIRRLAQQWPGAFFNCCQVWAGAVYNLSGVAWGLF